MRKGLLIILFSIASLTLKAQSFTSQQQQVNSTIAKFFDGIAELDFDKMKGSATNDIIILENGAIWTMDSLTSRLEPLKKMSYKRTNNLTFIKTEIKGNTAWVYYNNIADIIINEKPRNANWLESAVLVKEGEDWKVKLLHSTTIPKTK